MHIPFVRMVKFKLLAQFPVDHHAYPVVSSLIFFLCKFAAFAYYVIDLFCLYHHIIYICWFVASYLFLLWYDWSLWHCFVLLLQEIQFLLQDFLFVVTSKFFSREILLVCRLKYPYSCFSSHFCFLVIFILLILVFSVLFLLSVISFLLRFFLRCLRVIVSVHWFYLECW